MKIPCFDPTLLDSMTPKNTSAPLRLCVSLLLLAYSTILTAAQPNVILIITDDQGYGDFSAHGNPVLKTPNMDLLRKSSVSFTDFHVAPMCSPTRGQLMTGIDAMRNGCTAVCQGRSMMRSELPTMANFFADAGYATGHFGKWHLGDSYPHRPQDRGFQETIHHRAWGITSLADHWDNHTDVYFGPILSHNGVDKKFEGYCTDIFFDESMKWIEKQQAADQPFFLYLPTNTPHVPNICPEEFSSPYVGEHEGKKIPAEFYGMIANLDENLGRLEAFLTEKGLRDNSILIYLSDNGTQSTPAKDIFNSGMREKKTSVYEGGHRVPLFVRWPAGNLQHGSEIDELTQVQDLLPSLIDLCALESGDKSTDFDGSSLAGMLRGETKELPDRKLVIQYRASGAPWDPAVVLWDKWRLIGGDQLFDVGRDPGQATNVAGEHPEVVNAMSDHYDAWYAEAKPLFNKTRWITVGREAEPDSILYAQDWIGDYCDNMGGLINATAKGYWNVIVDREGTYEMELRRWPRESGKTLTEGRVGPQDRGRSARPISAANLQIAGGNFTLDAGDESQAVTFRVKLPAGQAQLPTGFLDSEDRILSSAFYVYLKRLPDDERGELSPVSERTPKENAPAPALPRVKATAKVSLSPDDLLVSEFEADSYGDWTATGTAFGTGPTAEARVDTHSGKRLVDTFVIGKGDAATGTLASPKFKLERKHLHFLIGGGNHQGKTCVNLLVEGKVVRTATGSASKNRNGKKIMRWVSWDVTQLKGQDARIGIVDQATGGWGHIVVDQIFQSNKAPDGAK